nr:rhodanese-like domain-containing protein [Marinagarivorans cellulosilyticus]
MDFVAEQWILVSLLLVLIVAFMTFESKKGGKTVSYHEVSRLLNSEEAILLDVRDSADYKAGHIIDAINIPHGSLATRLGELEKYKAKQVIVTDKMGQHSGHAGKVLREAGFEAVRMQGGMAEWNAQKLPVIKAGKNKGKKG